MVDLPLWKILLSWDDDIPNWMESHKIHVPNHQPVFTVTLGLFALRTAENRKTIAPKKHVYSEFSAGKFTKKHHRFSKSKIAHMFPAINLPFMVDFPWFSYIFPRFVLLEFPASVGTCLSSEVQKHEGSHHQPRWSTIGQRHAVLHAEVTPGRSCRFIAEKSGKIIGFLFDLYGVLHRLIWISMWYGYKCVIT